MSRYAKLFAANVIGAAGLCSAALAMSASASAEPVPPPAIPNVPALSMLQQFATNPASMGAVLQTAATALNGASAIVGAPAPSTLPVSPIPGAPATPPVPESIAPVGPGSSLVPLLNQLGVPANMANLTTSSMPFPIAIGDQVGIGPAPQADPVTLPPAGAAPIAPAPPTGGVASPLPLLNALP
jgi:hypothetical protein